MTDELYVGYQRRAPPGIAGFVRRLVSGLLLLAAAVAGVLAGAQADFAPGRFEWGEVRELAGVVREAPYPLLLVERPGGAGEPSAWLLSAFGKRGAQGEVSGLDGHAVTARGTLIYRQGITMVQIEPGSVEPAGPGVQGTSPAAVWEDLGEVTVTGEVVDGKCHLGVMKPGRGQAHRACAIRCLSGGIPPLFAVDGDSGVVAHLLLVDENRGPLPTVDRAMTGLSATASGRLWRREGLHYLAVAAGAIQPIRRGDTP